MAKRTRLETEDFNIDNDLNFDDFNLDEVEGGINPEIRKTKSRDPVTEVFKGTLDGAKSKFKDPAFLAGVVKKSLPDTYGEVLDSVNYAAGSLGSLYDEQLREIKPQVSRLAKKIDKLVPEESKTLKKITQKFKDFVGDEVTFASTDKKVIQDKSVADALASVFNAQNEVNQQLTARESVETRVRDSIEGKRFQSNFGILSSIDNGITRLAAYNDRVNQAYQKKSLELQFRSYFVQSELLETTSKYFKVFEAQNAGIAKNTALPEFVKIKNSERFKDLARTKFMDSIQRSLFGNGDFMKRGIDRMRQSVGAFTKSFKASLEGLDMATDSISDLQENNKMLAEMGLDPVTKSSLLGQTLGSGAANFVGNKLGSKIREYSSKAPGIVKAGYKAAAISNNLPGAIDTFRRSDYVSENIAKDGLKSKAIRGLDMFLSMFGEETPDMAVDGLGGLSKVNEPAIFDSRVYRSVTDIIPGYLSRILREVTVTNTGDKKTALTLYDFNKSAFITKKELAADIKQRLGAKFKESGMDYHLQNVIRTMTGDEKVSPDAEVKLKEFFSKLSTIPNMDYSPERIQNTRAFNALDTETSSLVKSALEAKGSNSDSREKFKYDLTKGMNQVKRSMPDLRGDLEAYIRAGQGDVLVKAGLAIKDKDGNYKIDEEAYYDLARENGIVRSDINVKQNISKFSPKAALSAIKKTRVYDWFYKLGKGDDKPHIGPMAQDVKTNMGEEAAPGGTSIDITSMNGINMSAIQALSDKLDKQTGDKDSYTVLVGIKKDTSEIVELLRKGSTSGASVSTEAPSSKSSDTYATIFGNIVTSTMTIASKAASDIFNTSSKAFEFGKDKVARPIKDALQKAYTDNKDKVSDTFKALLNKAGELGLKTLNFANDVLFNKLPAGYRELAIFGKKAKDKLLEIINGPIDIYIKGIDKPLIRAKLMELGFYFDQASGKVIKTIDDIKGPVVDKFGNVVLTIEDISKGLVDNHGNDIKNAAGKILSFAIGSAIKGYNRAKDIFKSLASGISDTGGGLFSKIKEKFNNGNLSILGQDRIYDVLVEIRDILRGEDPPRHEEKKEFRKNFIGPMPQTEFSKIKDKTINKAKYGIGKIKDSSLGKKVTNLFKAKKDEEAVEDKTSSSDNTPRYKSATNVIDSILSFGSNIAKKAKDKLKSKKESDTKPKLFNDRDGDGKRDGSWEDRLAKEDEREKERKRNKAEAPKVDPRYKSDKNVIDTLMEKASGLFGMLSSGVGGLLGTVGNIVGSIGGVLGIGGKAGLLGKLAGGAMSAGKLVGTGALAAGKLAAGTVARVGLLTAAKSALGLGALLTTGTGSAIMAAGGVALGALGSLLASPVVLGTIAAYGAYKAYKYITRDDADEYQTIRLKQYGLATYDTDKVYNHYVLQLEEYLCDGKITYSSNKASIIAKKVDTKELLSIFTIDPNDEERIAKFNSWFNDRFKPFFLTHLSALFSVNNKARLADVKKLSLEERIKYLSLISFESGPYSVSTSPFKGLEYVNVDKTVPLNAIKALVNKLTEEQKAKSKKNKDVDKDKADSQKKSTPPKTIEPEPAKPLPGTNIPVDKDKSNLIDKGEDGPVKESTNENQTTVSPGKLTEAKGPIFSGENAGQFIKVAPGVNIDNLNPALLKNFKAMVQEYGETTGNTVKVNDGVRSRAEQEALYRKNPEKAAKPGKSLHEFGLALDIDSKILDELESLGLMRKYGFTRPVGGEPWHTEPAGIQGNINKAKEDAGFADTAISASLFKGGGGVGTVSSFPKYRRDTKYALSLMNIDAAPVTNKSVATEILTEGKSINPSINKPQTTVAANDQKINNATTVSQETTIANTDARSEKTSKISQLPVNMDSRPAIVTNEASNDAETKPNEVGIDVIDSSKTKLTGDVKTDIANISKRAGADPNMMTAFAAVESSLNPNAKANTSSASGLFQFTKTTWNEQIGKHGKKYGLDPTVSPTDVNASTLMASEYVKNNIRLLGNVKPNPNLTDVYLAHFLGPTGARKFLTADPNAIAAQILPDAARSNPNIFYSNGKPLTISEVYSRLSNKLSKTATQFGIQVQADTFANSNNSSGSKPREYGALYGINGKPVGSNTANTYPSIPGQPINKEAAAVEMPKEPFRKPPIFGQQLPTIIGPNANQSATKPIDSSAQALGSVSSTLDKSLNVQTEMLEVLKKILNNVSAENINSIKETLIKATNQVDNKSTGAAMRNDTRPQAIPESSIDLRRKII